jgi:hypothetical protein
MPDDAERFRKRARECRLLAAEAPNAHWRDKLIEIADDLDACSDRIEQEQAARPSPAPRDGNGRR